VERLDALKAFLDHYNCVRPHTAIGNRPPASRLSTTLMGTTPSFVDALQRREQRVV
jgi:hypothetical protein